MHSRMKPNLVSEIEAVDISTWQFYGRLEPQGKLPTHTEHNPKHNVSMISLISGKSYEGPHIL